MELGDGLWYYFNVDGKLIVNVITLNEYNIVNNGILTDAFLNDIKYVDIFKKVIRN